VSYSPAFKWFIGVLLPLTFAWKLAADTGDPNEILKAVAEFLRHQEFEAAETEEVIDGMWAVRARRGDCRLFVVEISGKGWTKELTRLFADTSDQLFIVVQGSAHEKDSTWLAIANDIYVRALRKIRLARPAPILGVAASPICAAERLPWNEL
jgi:hypothetical protein